MPAAPGTDAPAVPGLIGVPPKPATAGAGRLGLPAVGPLALLDGVLVPPLPALVAAAPDPAQFAWHGGPTTKPVSTSFDPAAQAAETSGTKAQIHFMAGSTTPRRHWDRVRFEVPSGLHSFSFRE
jgi:hypothetical protein